LQTLSEIKNYTDSQTKSLMTMKVTDLLWRTRTSVYYTNDHVMLLPVPIQQQDIDQHKPVDGCFVKENAVIINNSHCPQSTSVSVRHQMHQLDTSSLRYAPAINHSVVDERSFGWYFITFLSQQKTKNRKKQLRCV